MKFHLLLQQRPYKRWWAVKVRNQESSLTPTENKARTLPGSNLLASSAGSAPYSVLTRSRCFSKSQWWKEAFRHCHRLHIEHYGPKSTLSWVTKQTLNFWTTAPQSRRLQLVTRIQSSHHLLSADWAMGFAPPKPSSPQAHKAGWGPVSQHSRFLPATPTSPG